MAQNSAAVEKVVHLEAKRASRPIDLVHLAKQCLGDEHLEYEILRLFDTTVQNYLARLAAATTQDERTMVLHSIKGAAAGVGAWTLSELAKLSETDLLAGRDMAPEHMSDIAIAIEEVRSFIAHMLSNEPK